MVATTGGFFVPSLRFATASVLCDGELDQRLPVSNKRLNLYCNPADGDEPYAVGFMPYLDARGLRRRLPHRENSAACAGPAGRRRRIGSCPSTGSAVVAGGPERVYPACGGSTYVVARSRSWKPACLYAEAGAR